MKVLMLAPGRIPHSYRPAQWLLQNGHQVFFLDSVNPGLEVYGNFSFIPYPKVGVRILPRLFGRRLGRSISYALTAIQFKRIAWALHPDIVHVHYIDDRAWNCARAGLTPLILSAWGSDINRHFWPDADLNYREQISWTLTRSTAIIVDADDIAEKCHLLTKGAINTIKMPLGVNVEKFYPNQIEVAQTWRQRLGISPDAKVLFSMRALQPHYGHHRILAAFASACQKLSCPMVLIFKRYNSSENNGHQYELELLADINRLNLHDRVFWIDEIPFESLYELYALSDIVINYPSYDAFPVTFQEAGASGCSVITVDLPSYRGTFAEKYFRLVPPDDVEALARAIEAEVCSEPDRSRMQIVRQIIESEFSETQTAQKLGSLYSTLVKQLS